MNEFSNRMGALAQNVGRDFEATAADDSAALIRRARRGRVVWTGAVGTATLASAAVIAVGGSAAANNLFGESLVPATHSPSATPTESASASPTPSPTESESATPEPSATADDHGKDDPTTHDATDDKGGEKGHSESHKSGAHKSGEGANSGKQLKDCDDAKTEDGDHKGGKSEDGGTHHNRGGDDAKGDDHRSGDDDSKADDHGSGNDDVAGTDDSGKGGDDSGKGGDDD